MVSGLSVLCLLCAYLYLQDIVTVNMTVPIVCVSLLFLKNDLVPYLLDTK